ncbi:MAG: TRAP transporter small permease [Kiloniellales bacterium]
MSTALDSLARRLDRVAAGLLGLLLLALVALNVVNAAGRYLFGRSLPGADEILLYGMIWLVFLGMIQVTAKRRHLQLDLLERWLPGRGKLLQRLLVDLLIAILCGYLASQSMLVVERLGSIGQTSMAAGLPMAWVHGGLLVGLGATAFTAGLQAILGVLRLLRGLSP